MVSFTSTNKLQELPEGYAAELRPGIPDDQQDNERFDFASYNGRVIAVLNTALMMLQPHDRVMDMVPLLGYTGDTKVDSTWTMHTFVLHHTMTMPDGNASTVPLASLQCFTSNTHNPQLVMRIGGHYSVNLHDTDWLWAYSHARAMWLGKAYMLDQSKPFLLTEIRHNLVAACLKVIEMLEDETEGL